MIVIDYPNDTCQKFFKFDNTYFGPIDPTGNYSAVQIDLPLTEELFKQSKGILDENNVEHSSFHGRIYYYPILADCVPLPQVGFPMALRVPIKESPKYRDINYGFACPDIGAHCVNSSAQQVHQTVIRNGSTWTLYRLISSSAAATSCGVYKHVISFKRWLSATSAEITYSYSYGASFVPCPFDMKRSASAKQIMKAVSLVTKWTVYAPTVRTVTVDTTDPSVVSTPSQLTQNLDSFANNLMNEEFPLIEINYGELAARAVKQRKLIDMNVYEFLRDLPDAKDMIPKLKNLSKLKTHAGNFLAVKYGVMPTISDLQAIVEAFKKRQPFFDKFGNTVFNASEKQEFATNSGYCTLAQYIKVPVANEDNFFLKLLERLDEVGLGLTFANAWELVKYSFVIDWFVDVGGFLERIDENLRLLRYNIPYVTMSRKKTVHGEISPLDGLTTVGPIEWRYYHRWVDSHCPLPPLTLSTTPTISNHWLEAGALIIQRAL